MRTFLTRSYARVSIHSWGSIVVIIMKYSRCYTVEWRHAGAATKVPCALHVRLNEWLRPVNPGQAQSPGRVK